MGSGILPPTTIVCHPTTEVVSVKSFLELGGARSWTVIKAVTGHVTEQVELTKITSVREHLKRGSSEKRNLPNSLGLEKRAGQPILDSMGSLGAERAGISCRTYATRIVLFSFPPKKKTDSRKVKS